MNLTYTATSTSYTIFKDNHAWITQSNVSPFSLPFKRESVALSAQAHIDEILKAEESNSPTRLDDIELALVELDMQRESDKTELELALAEIVEMGTV